MDKNLFEDVKRRFDEARFITGLGITLTETGDGLAVSVLDVEERHLQQDGFVHAGVVAAMADHTGGAAGWTLVDADKTVLTVEFKIHFLNPAKGPRLTCRSTVMRPGRKIISAESEVKNADGTLAAKLTMTLAVVSTTRVRS